MQDLLNIILPVFIVIGAGYLATRYRLVEDSHIDGLMRYAQGIAIPCLLFSAIAGLDLSQSFNVKLLASFYTGALSGFALGYLGARYLFGRAAEDSIAIGFIGLFSNSVLLGLPITERAFGAGALDANFAIIAIHSPLCYFIGITAMELTRAKGQSALQLVRTVGRAMFRNALIVGIALGFAVNLSCTVLPEFISSAVDLVKRSALPAALFGLGGVLIRYRPEGDAKVILYILSLSLILHPAIAFGLGHMFDLSDAEIRSAVLTGAMAPGINTYLFANIYGVGKRVAASAVLVGTALCLFTTWGWLQILP